LKRIIIDLPTYNEIVDSIAAELLKSDIDIVARSLEVVCDDCLVLEAGAAKIALNINKQKTKYMIATANRTIVDAGQTVAFGDKNFEVVNKFVYLEALVIPKNDVGLEIQQRIKSANRCFCGLRKQLRTSHLAR
jgi:hypothetical protein